MSIHDVAINNLDGSPADLHDLEGKAVLVVNVASKCGLTPQYTGLENLQQRYAGKGFTVLGVPCNQFGGQEPGSEAEIGAFCRKNYGVSFPLTAKNDVKGKAAHPFYKWAAEQAGMLGRPKWNFHKYLIARDGSFAAWFSSATKPTGPNIRKALEKVLG